MKFNASRKINLGNIDPILQFEMEELSVHDCDSPEEATQKLDLWVKERILFYREAVSKMKAPAPAANITRPAPAPAAPPPPPPARPAAPAAPAPQGPPAEFA